LNVLRVGFVKTVSFRGVTVAFFVKLDYFGVQEILQGIPEFTEFTGVKGSTNIVHCFK
jgi:hypothetical protein